MRRLMQNRLRTYRYITFANVDRGLLLRLLIDERYLLPSGGPGGQTAAVTVVYDRRSGWPTDPTGVIQGVAAGGRAYLDQLVEDSAAVFATTPLWRTNSDARHTFKRLEAVSLRQSLAGLAEVEARRALGDALPADDGHAGRGQGARLVERSRAAHRALLDLDELAMRCLREPGEHDETELAGLRAQRQDLSATIQDIQSVYAKLSRDDGQLPPL